MKFTGKLLDCLWVRASSLHYILLSHHLLQLIPSLLHLAEVLTVLIELLHAILSCEVCVNANAECVVHDIDIHLMQHPGDYKLPHVLISFTPTLCSLGQLYSW